MKVFPVISFSFALMLRAVGGLDDLAGHGDMALLGHGLGQGLPTLGGGYAEVGEEEGKKGADGEECGQSSSNTETKLKDKGICRTACNDAEERPEGKCVKGLKCCAKGLPVDSKPQDACKANCNKDVEKGSKKTEGEACGEPLVNFGTVIRGTCKPKCKHLFERKERGKCVSRLKCCADFISPQFL